MQSTQVSLGSCDAGRDRTPQLQHAAQPGHCCPKRVARPRRAALGSGERQQEQHRPGCRDLAEVPVPEVRRKLRHQRDREQQPGEGQRPPETQGGAVKGCHALGCGGPDLLRTRQPSARPVPAVQPRLPKSALPVLVTRRRGERQRCADVAANTGPYVSMMANRREMSARRSMVRSRLDWAPSPNLCRPRRHHWRVLRIGVLVAFGEAVSRRDLRRGQARRLGRLLDRAVLG